MKAWNPASYLFDVSQADWVKFDDTTQQDKPCNQAPLADAGVDQSVTIGSIVTLDGSGSSDPELDPLSYAWSFVSKPAGSTATLSDPSAVNPTFTAVEDGDYVIQLVVYDGYKDSAPDTVKVTATIPTATVGLCEKVIDENNKWVCKEGGATGTLTYNTIGNPDFDFTVAAQGLVASTDYTLMYFPDKPGWFPRDGIICLGNGKSVDGTLTLTGSATPGDLPKPYDDNCARPGAKIWLVPSGYLDCTTQVISGFCFPGDGCTQILFETVYITFDDLSDPNVCLP
jgi:hypothetical protein